MLVYPSKLKRNRLLKGRTLNFETVKKTHGNMIFIPSLNLEERDKVLASRLFRPMQLLSFYVPRKLKALGKTPIVIDQAEYYKDIKKRTNGRIKFGKINYNQYNGKNLVYDITEDYLFSFKTMEERKQGLMLQKYMKEYFENIIKNVSQDPDYEKNYIVFPMTKYIDDFRKNVKGSSIKTKDPLSLFLKSIYKQEINLSAFKNIDLIIFYNTNAEVLVAFDLNDPNYLDEFESMFLKLVRLNDFNNGSDTLSDAEETLDPNEEDEDENLKEDIKEAILKKISKTLKANLEDYEATTSGEKELILSIDEKIESFLNNPENKDKTFKELVDQVESDNDVKLKALRYVETKKMANQKLKQLSKNLDKEAEIIGSINDLSDDSTSSEPAIFDVDIPFFDERMKTSHLASFDEEYNNKQAMKDLSSVISSFSNSDYLPMAVESFEKEDTSDDFNIKDTINVKYKTDEGKILSFQIDIPKIVDKKYLYLSGNKKEITKQLLRLPIVKTKADRVEITSAFNKITCERTSGKLSRKNAYLLKILKNFEKNDNFEIVYGINGIDNETFLNDFEYEELANSVTMIKNIKYVALFNRKEIKKIIDTLNIPDDFLKETMTPFALEKSKEEYKKLFFIEKEKVFEVNLEDSLKINNLEKGTFEFLTENILNINTEGKLPIIGQSFVFSKMKFLATTYPILVVVGALNGLSDILKRYKIEYFLSEKKNLKNLDYIEVKFRDKYLYYKSSLKNSMLLNALYLMNTENYNFNDFDKGEPYDDWFVSKLGNSIGLHTRNTLKINLAMMIDPITIDVLKDLKYPTNIVDLLLLSNIMLLGNTYRAQNDLRNYRIRSNEVVYAMLYGILSETFVNYQKHRMNGRPLNLSIQRNKLISNLITLNTINDHSTLNPIQELENTANASAKGYKGVNTDDAFTLEMRAYDDSMNGIISGNATPYSGSAGITRSLSFDPKLSHVRGYIPDIDESTLSAANILSPTELLATFTTVGADAPRQAMQVSQTKHTMPVESSSKQLLGSGLNKTLAFMISDDFCFKAKNNGIIKSIDDENKLALLSYDDGTNDAIDLNEIIVKNSNSGFFIKQKFLIRYKEGEKFKKDDVIAYNPSYFSGKGKNVDYMPGTLAKVAIASGDFAFEDSTIISESLSKKCTSKVTMMTDVALGPNSIIYKLVEIGDVVKTNDKLIEFTSSFVDPSTSEFLKGLSDKLDSETIESLTRDSVKTKYSGTIVGMKIYYNTAFENLSESLKKLVLKYKKQVEKRKDALKGIKTTSVHIPPVEKINATKIGTKEFSKEGGVIIQI